MGPTRIDLRELRSHRNELEKIEITYQQEKQVLEQSFQSQIQRLKQELEEKRSQESKQKANFESRLKVEQEKSELPYISVPIPIIPKELD